MEIVTKVMEMSWKFVGKNVYEQGLNDIFENGGNSPLRWLLCGEFF